MFRVCPCQVFTIALPIVAEYGFAVGVYQDGWLSWAGFDATGGLKWTMVHSTCGFLFALAMDYDLFLFARVYERRQQGYDNASAVRLSLEETGPLITLAGTIMVISFAFVFVSSVPVIAQIGCQLRCNLGRGCIGSPCENHHMNAGNL